jgi:hypothetical protein
MVPSRLLAAAPDGSHVLRPGRLYRLVVVVNGATTIEALGDALIASGFDEHDLCISAPEDWQYERPADWPDEGPAPEVAANECAVRASGSYRAGSAARYQRDRAIEPGATYTIARCWDYGAAAAPERVGAGATTTADKGAASGLFERPLLLGGIALAGLFGWRMIENNRKEERERARLLRAATQIEREEVAKRVHELLAGGHGREEAHRIAEGEREDRELAEARVLEAREA